MITLISRGINVLKQEGFASFLMKTGKYLQTKRTPFIQNIDQIAKSNYLLGVIIVPIYCLFNLYLVEKKKEIIM